MKFIKQAGGEINNSRSSVNDKRPVIVHIAIIAEDLRPPLDEGAKKTVYLLSRAFTRRGVKVSVFTRYDYPSLECVHKLPCNKFLLGGKFRRILRSEELDFILYIPSSSGTIGAFIRAAGIRIQSPGQPLALLNLQYRNLPKFLRHLGLARSIDLVFSQSQNSVQVFQSLGLKSIVLPGAVNCTQFQPVDHLEKSLLRSRYGFKETDKVVLHVGHCKPHRNVKMLARLVDNGYQATMITSTSTIADHELLEELKLAGVNVITGFIENIQHYYQLADCYLFPVINPTSAIDAPLSVLEAMACNLPVVTTKFGALPEMFPHTAGFYYAETDEEMIQGVNQALEIDQGTTREMVAQYSWENLASTILETLHKTGIQ